LPVDERLGSMRGSRKVSRQPARTMAIPFDDIRRWTFDQALPLWADAGVDRLSGGYVEQLGFDGRDAGADFKRVRVICRQIYVFSHANVLGWTGGLDAARAGYEFLVARARLRDGGWARTLTREGTIKDPTQDLYDLAFVIFALSWFHRASKEAEPLRLALETLNFIDTNMSAAGGGYLAERPAPAWRLQNPHMHLLEAVLAGLEASGERQFRAVADSIVELFHARFYDPASETLAEYFADDWSRAKGDLGRTVEPGHQFEWCWILANYQRLTRRDMRESVRGLARFAETFGVDPATGATFNQVRDDGQPIDRGSRTWPNTERIKAHIALFELFGADPSSEIARSVDLLLARYFGDVRAGLWMDQFDVDGRAATAHVPASTLYHVFLAFAEVLRIEPAVREMLATASKRSSSSEAR
jgi:mannose/cellobiose epimerase-like protein (N-acyl-D-glucosamine 2-epimerase family)